jgi:hypothetical protein
LPEAIPWERLSQTTTATLLAIAAPLTEGYKIEDVATRLGLKIIFARRLLDEAACELLELTVD